MDTSFWIQYNPNITVDHTPKKYFGKYLYKLVVYAPGGRLIDQKESVPEALVHRRSVHKNFNYGGSWGVTDIMTQALRQLNEADIDFLTSLKELRKDRSWNVKIRIEEPMMQIYCNDEDRLKDIVNNHFHWTWKKYVRSISGPRDAEAAEILNSGAIIKKSDLGYRYKVILRDGSYGTEVKNSVLNYLVGLGPEQIHIPQSCFNQLQKSSSFIWNTYFYTNDEHVISFLGIISPGMVSNYHELVVLPNK